MQKMNMWQKKEVKKKEVVFLTRSELQKKLMSLFPKHIGRDNAITKGELYVKIWGDTENYKDYEIYFNWQRIRVSLNWIRRTTKMFIVSAPTQHNRIFYILKDWEDLKPYDTLLENNTRKMVFMRNRAANAVSGAWYREFEE